jgi:hypothetical protein
LRKLAVQRDVMQSLFHGSITAVSDTGLA